MNFQGFSTDSFEQFIRALSLKLLGPGVTVFGNGPDGGREATFKGKISYPYPPETTWDGYGVIQAKFKEKIEDTQTEQAWAEKQLRAELKRWEKSEKRNPKPDYFVFCTNVELTSAANGGRAALETVLEKSKTTLGLRGYAIWDANQLKGFVDGCEEIRKRFLCFFTTGDLLAEFAKVLRKVPDPDAVLTAYLCREILADEDARLSQAGDRSEDRIRLADVFVDLPVARAMSAEPPVEEEGEMALPPASLHVLLRASAQKLDSLTLHERRQSSETTEQRPDTLYGRFVFLGGPGSGKSTIGQFLAQIHRAALLLRRPFYRLEYRVQTVINGIRSRCEEEKVTWPATPRYPFRVELNGFAKALAAGPKIGVSSLSEWLRKSLSVDSALSHEDLRDWLRAFPWLLILDGLDEVPASSNRREVIAAIQNFLNEAKDVEADLMIVASSRPDGYAGEFDGDEVAQRYLLPLSKARALACAKRYVDAKGASKGDQRSSEAMAILKGAVENPLIARLMRSPLQVTFMVTVVAASGKPSESRWQLFHDYYRTIYERELHKAVRPFDIVLNERRQDIDALHHRVGFILQCRAESSGGTASELTIGEFEQLVTTCLEENGLAPDQLSIQKEMIVGAANQRLVFITSRSPGKLSFDVRSLQEYMAAACLTNADSADVVVRLESIAHSAYWRNTLLFAVGRFFVEPQMRSHRDKIRILCEDLNRKDSGRAAAKLGSRLALEISESGTVGNVPLVSRSLASCALALLDNPPAPDDTLGSRMAAVYDIAMEQEYKTAILLRIGQKKITQALAAWLLLLYLEKKGVQWAATTVSQKWPAAIDDALAILTAWLSNQEGDDPTEVVGLTDNDRRRLIELLPRLDAERASELLTMVGTQTVDSQALWLSPLIDWSRAGRSLEMKVLSKGGHVGLTVRARPVPDSEEADSFGHIKTILTLDVHPDWKTLAGVCEFYGRPTASSLAACLAHFSESASPAAWKLWSQNLPWPVACFLSNAESKESLLWLVAEIRRHEETVDAWIAKQREWGEDGITLETFLAPVFPGGPRLINAVMQASVGGGKAELVESFARDLFSAMQTEKEKGAKNTLAWIFCFFATCKNAWGLFDPLEIERDLLPARNYWWHHDFIVTEIADEQKRMPWIRFYDALGKLDKLNRGGGNWRLESAPTKELWAAFKEDTTLVGALKLVGYWCSVGAKVDVNATDLVALNKVTDPGFQFTAALVRILRQTLTHQEALLEAEEIYALVVGADKIDLQRTLLEAVSNHAKEIPALDVILRRLEEATPPSEWKMRGRTENLKIQFLQARPSGFDRGLLESLHLPFIRT